MTIQEQFSKMKNEKSLAFACFIQSKGGKGMNWCPKVDELSRYFDKYVFCFTIFSQFNGKSDDNYVVYESTTKHKILIILNINVPDEFLHFTKLTMHNRRELLTQSLSKGEINLNKNNKNLLITYQKTVVK